MAKSNSQHLTFRPMGLSDIPNIARWFWHFKDAAYFDRGLPVPLNEDTLRDAWSAALAPAALPTAFWFLAEDCKGTPLGIGGLERVSYIQGDAVVPMFVAPDYRRKGLAKLMSMTLMNMAFDTLRLHRLTTYYRADNAASAKLLQDLGFSTEGRFREGWFVDGVRKDVVIAGILASEWHAKREHVNAEITASYTVSFGPDTQKADHN